MYRRPNAAMMPVVRPVAIDSAGFRGAAVTSGISRNLPADLTQLDNVNDRSHASASSSIPTQTIVIREAPRRSWFAWLLVFLLGISLFFNVGQLGALLLALSGDASSRASRSKCITPATAGQCQDRAGGRQRDDHAALHRAHPRHARPH